MRLQRSGCGCGPISRPLFACCTALYLRLCLWRCFRLKLISFGRLAGWLAGWLAWLLVKWLGPMQRWLIPRSSRVKVGRHSVDGKESKPQPKQQQKQKLKQKHKHKLKAKPYWESNSYRRYDSFILFVSRKRTNKPNWSDLTYLVPKLSSKEFRRPEWNL